MKVLFDDWDLISTYSRAQAIEDGVLIDVTDIAIEAGFRWPVAVTSAVWEDCVAWSDEDTHRKGVPQDEAGRLWDVLFVARHAAKRSPAVAVRFDLRRIPRFGRGHLPRRVTLKIGVGPGDDASPVITISQPHED